VFFVVLVSIEVFTCPSVDSRKKKKKKKVKKPVFLEKAKKEAMLGQKSSVAFLFCKGIQADATTQHTMLNPMNL